MDRPSRAQGQFVLRLTWACLSAALARVKLPRRLNIEETHARLSATAQFRRHANEGAMKGGDKVRVGALRLIMAALKDRETRRAARAR